MVFNVHAEASKIRFITYYCQLTYKSEDGNINKLISTTLSSISEFDPNLQQALAWKRLETGTHTQDDVTWIKHECAERHHELKYGSGYNEAHNRAQTRFDGAPWENQF